jgi:hypothetical protein
MPRRREKEGIYSWKPVKAVADVEIETTVLAGVNMRTTFSYEGAEPKFLCV